MRYTETDILAACGHSALRHGRTYLAQGRVLDLDAGDDVIEAEVVGTAASPYLQSIVVRERRGGVRIEGRCTCPVGFNCKHVAAALLSCLSAKGQPAPSVESRIARVLDPPRLHGFALPLPRAQGDLPHGFVQWFANLDRARATASEDYPAAIHQRLIYVLSPIPAGARMPRLGAQALSARRLKDGGLSETARPYVWQAGGGAKFLRPSDLRILRAAALLTRDYAVSGHWILAQEGGAEILAEILATGRARWLTVNGPALAPAPSRPGRLAWRPAANDTLLPHLDLDGAGEALAASPPVYVDPAAGLVGPIETGLSARIAGALLAMPEVPADAVPALNAALAQRAPELAAHRPPVPPIERLSGVAPVPVLRLILGRLPGPGGYGVYHPYQPVEPAGLARLAFRYGPVTTALGETRPVATRLAEGRLYEVERDPGAERRALGRLLTAGLVPVAERTSPPPEHARDLVPEDGQGAWAALQYDLLPRLRQDGWVIETAPDFPTRLVRADGVFEAEIREGSGIDWLDLDLGVEVDGERIDLVGPIVAMIARPDFSPAALPADGEAPLVIPLPDGRLLALPAARLRPIVSAILELALGGAAQGGRLRLTGTDAASLAAFEAATEAAGIAWRGGEAIRAMGRRLAEAGGLPPVTLPEEFRAILRPYQAQGVAWLALLREAGFGGVLADDMGLGKTVQALGLLAIEKAEGRLDRPALVVAPTSLMDNWRREAERFAPALRVLTLHGLDRKARFGAIPDHDLVLTTYPLIPRDHAALKELAWHLVILDEAQAVKNPDAATTQLLHGIAARHRFCLTGTPLENNLGEVWSLFSFACPGLLGERRAFARTWRTPIEKQGDRERGRLLARRVKPFLLRRTKEEVAGDLPPKTEIIERIDLDRAQRDLYESIRLAMHAKVRAAIAEKGLERSRIIILDALLKLRQACCDPRLLKLDKRPKDGSAKLPGSAKLDRLAEMLEELLAEGRRVLVFSQFTAMLDLIKPRLQVARTRYVELTGRTRDRAEVVRLFEAGEAEVFLISLKAGGTGLNLVSADTVILYDPWWNLAVEDQATDRAHRIGQDKPVFVHKLVAARTIEEKMEALKERKSALAQSLFDHDGAPTGALTAADLDVLLGA